MVEPVKTEDLRADVQEVMKALVTAIRTVKVYPSNNPIYSQSIKKAFEPLSTFLQTESEYRLGVQKTMFTYQNTPFSKEAQVNRSIAQDLFLKNIREIIFSTGVSEEELTHLLQAFALSSEEMAIKSGISSILWENEVSHIKVAEAGLDDVITRTDERWSREDDAFKSLVSGEREKKPAAFAGKTLVLGDARTDPAGFGAGMVAFAMKTKGEHETVEDRLFSLYQQASKKIQKDHAQESEELFEGLAQSVLALEPEYRERFIAGKLYGDLDAELAETDGQEQDQQFPNPVQEIQTGRFANVWNAQQVSSLLKRSAAKVPAPAAPVKSVAELEVEPVTPELIETARSLVENPDPAEELQKISSAGMESDILEAAVRTLVTLIPVVKNPGPWSDPEKDAKFFSGVITQLEDILSYLLQKNNYDLATVILKALQQPVAPEFQQRMTEALRKTANKSIIVSTITDMRAHPKSSPEYQAAYAYLSTAQRKASGILLELLAEENDRDARIFLLDLLKDLGKNQIDILGSHLADSRWYVVRNVVSILAESKTDQAILLLRKAADHTNIQIRQEVIKALLANKGKRAASVLTRFFRDQDDTLKLTAIKAFADFTVVGEEEVRPLVEFLQDQPLSRKEQELTLEAIKTLGKVGGSEAERLLQHYPRHRWWKSRALQRELRQAAVKAVVEIRRRQRNAGPAQ